MPWLGSRPRPMPPVRRPGPTSLPPPPPRSPGPGSATPTGPPSPPWKNGAARPGPRSGIVRERILGWLSIRAAPVRSWGERLAGSRLGREGDSDDAVPHERVHDRGRARADGGRARADVQGRRRLQQRDPGRRAVGLRRWAAPRRHRHRGQGRRRRRRHHHRRAVPRGQGAARRVLDRQLRRPRRGTRPRRPRHRGLPGPGRGPPVPGRARGVTPPAVDIAGIFRAESGRSVATLVRLFGDIDIAEEAVQDAFAVALERWPSAGLPPNPGAWITTTARNRAIDRLRRESSRHDRHAQAALLQSADEPIEPVGPVSDDRLRLIFTCCHPALAPEAQIALTLRLLGGLQTPEIARAFLVQEATMAARITRAKKKIAGAKIPYRVPGDAELPDRLKPVLAVVYLIFNEGYIASAGDDLIREDLCAEAVRLARLLAELMPDEAEVLGLLALLLLTESRRAARTAADGGLVLLPD